MEDRTQTKLLSTQKELSFSRSIYSTPWGGKNHLMMIDPRGKHPPYEAHVRSVELRAQRKPGPSKTPKPESCSQGLTGAKVQSLRKDF